MASKNHLWVVAGLSERVGDVAYNTVALINRQHNLACTYREVHLSREEWKEGVRPGDECPVFDTGFGCVGMQTCCDGFFPQSTAIPPGKGAEVIVASTWGDTLPDADGKVSGETVFRARARDNGVYLASAVYDGNSLVIDPMDRILALDAGKTGVFWAEVDLSKRECLDWVGYWRSIGPRDRVPKGPWTPPRPTRRRGTLSSSSCHPFRTRYRVSRATATERLRNAAVWIDRLSLMYLRS